MINLNSSLLSTNYVFYERLMYDSEATNLIYNNAVGALQRTTIGLTEYNNSVADIRSLAQQELQKEVELLNTVFQANISIDLHSKDSIKELIETLNVFLNLKAVYERNKYQLLNQTTRKDISGMFDSYFFGIWNKEFPQIEQQIANTLNNNPTQTVVQVADKILSEKLEDITSRALYKMFNSNTEKDKEDKQKPYQELISMIDQVVNGNKLSKQIYDIYKLDVFKTAILEEYKKSSTKTTRSTISRLMKQDKSITRTRYSEGGLSLELVYNAILQKLTSASMPNANFTGGAYHSGKANVKADNIITFNIDGQVVKDTLEESGRVSYIENKAKMERLQTYLNNLDNSFIVYSSAKNYTINEGFANRKGFSAGTPMSIETFLGLFGSVFKNMESFAGAMLQLGKGAIGHGTGMKQQLQEALAHKVAYLLFDDYTSIGLPNSGAQALHVFNLNGILIPLSFFLWIFADAIEFYLTRPERLVSINITAPAILYPDGEGGIARWNHQREYARMNTIITTHFFGDFQSVMAKYL